MLKKLSIAFTAGSIGGIATVLFLIIAGGTGLMSAIGITLPSFANTGFLYKQIAWGGLWGLLFALPLFGTAWVQRGLVIGLMPALATLFVFFPLGTTSSGGPGVAGLGIGVMMPVLVIVANGLWGLLASRLYSRVNI